MQTKIYCMLVSILIIAQLFCIDGAFITAEQNSNQLIQIIYSIVCLLAFEYFANIYLGYWFYNNFIFSNERCALAYAS